MKNGLLTLRRCRLPWILGLFVLATVLAAGTVYGADDTPGHVDETHTAGDPPLWMVGFFVAMLLSIAILPLTPAHHWWEHNRNRLMVAVLLALTPGIYYAMHDWHELAHVMMHEYVPFIVLLGSLFVIAGGIRLTGDLLATPLVNSTFIAVGTALASFIGTTGASMLLIRPLLQTNLERKYRVHTVVFFIFLVSNIGGSLLPIGDPPLFLGYLAGVPFFWTLRLWSVWLPTSLVLLAMYYVLDTFYLRREPEAYKKLDVELRKPLRLEGARNFIWLFGVVAAVIWMHGKSPVPAFRFLYCRELTMILMVALALLTGDRKVWRENRFSLGPINEVAALFLGIFITMIPALALLKAHGGELGIHAPWQYFWGTGILSSFLDNAPTYLVFFNAASGAVESGALEAVKLVGTGEIRVPESVLVAISLGAVFMGANTYIGNGPNFMVRAIAQDAGVRMPTFFGYMAWSMVFLIPVFVAVTFVFLR